MSSELALSTLKHIKGVMSPSGNIRRDTGMSPNSSDGNYSRAVIPDTIECTTSSVSLDRDGGSIDLGFTMDALVQDRKS